MQRDFLNTSPQLAQSKRIQMIAGILRIEGSTLTEEQASAVFDGKPVLASARELAEVKGAIAAYDKLSENPLKPGDLLEAHRLMMGDVLNHAGSFRNKQVGVYKGKEVVHVAPPELIKYGTDANGRMGSLWQTLILAQWKPLFVDMPLESVFKTHQQDYDQALGNADSAADSTVLITFILKATYNP